MEVFGRLFQFQVPAGLNIDGAQYHFTIDFNFPVIIVRFPAGAAPAGANHPAAPPPGGADMGVVLNAAAGGDVGVVLHDGIPAGLQAQPFPVHLVPVQPVPPEEFEPENPGIMLGLQAQPFPVNPILNALQQLQQQQEEEEHVVPIMPWPHGAAAAAAAMDLGAGEAHIELLDLVGGDEHIAVELVEEAPAVGVEPDAPLAEAEPAPEAGEGGGTAAAAANGNGQPPLQRRRIA